MFAFKTVFLVAFVAVITPYIIAQTVATKSDNSIPNLELAKQIEPLFELIVEREVRASSRMHWCRTIDYSRGVFGESKSRLPVKNLSGRPIKFDKQAVDDWEELWEAIHSVDERFISVSNVLVTDGRIQYSEFRLSTNLSLWSLIYSPEARMTGPDVPKLSQRLNEFWLLERVMEE
jgi:hypothetical protein